MNKLNSQTKMTKSISRKMTISNSELRLKVMNRKRCRPRRTRKPKNRDKYVALV